MKKIFLSLMLAMTVMPMTAQEPGDTIWLGNWVWNYYHRGNEWTEAVVDENGNIRGGFELYYTNVGQLEYIGGYNTTANLKILGLAAAIQIEVDTAHLSAYADTTMAGRVDEYLRLYKATPDTVVLLAQKSIKNVAPTYKMQLRDLYYNMKIYYADLYEVYFDNPIEMTDSFYVGITMYNNESYKHPETGVFFYECKSGALSRLPTPGKVKWRNLAYADEDSTTWNTLGGPGVVPYYWLMAFPIVDTTGLSEAEKPDLAGRLTYMAPNPATDKTTVFSSFRIKNVKITNAEGRLVETVPADGYNTTFDVSHYPKGIYMVTIMTDAGLVVKKLLVP